VILELISEAQASGVRLGPACGVLGISARTIERWRANPQVGDRRCGPQRRSRNALSPAEEAQVVSVLTSSRYAGLSPKQLVPQLADEGLYLASESTMYRLQRRYGLRTKKRTTPRTHVARASTVHQATRPNQVWSWDISWLPTTVRGTYLYLYLIMDVWSRCIVGWRIAQRESADIAAALMQQACCEGNVDPRGLVLHSDNGPPMRGSTMISTLRWLGVVPSFSRPHVCDDNPYSEALFRTLKHTPAYPQLPFVDLVAANRWMARFVEWYNGTHRHSAIRYVTPDQRHHGRDRAVLASRHKLYERARGVNPERWSGSTRNWVPVDLVVLNPERAPHAP
jgi:transposase InsO family protein